MRAVATWLAVVAATCAIGATARADVSTWTAQLADPQTRTRALAELEQLGDPSALDALAAAWSAADRDPRILRVLVAIARPLGKRHASWPRIQPVLVAALRALDPKDATAASAPYAIDSATVAADAIGEAHLVAAEPDLAALARRQPSKATIAAQVAAIRALGQLAGAAGAGATLRALVERDRPSDADARMLYETETAAAINSLGALRDDHARTTLILAAYRTPELMQQIRRALAALGPHATAELRAILRGEDAEVNALFARAHLDRACDPEAPDHCGPTSTMDFYAAVLVADQHDASAVPELVAALARPALPPYAGAEITQRAAMFSALRTLGAAAAADPVHTIWMDHAQDVATRTAALSIYPYVARDDAAAADLADIANDHDAEDALRVEAATALSRLAHDAHAIELLQALAKRYRDVGTRERARADGQPRDDARAADAALAAAQQRADRAKTAVRTIAADPHASAAKIRAATADAGQAGVDLVAATKARRERSLQFHELDDAANADLGAAHTLQVDLASVEVAMRCGADIACYAAALEQTPAAVATHLASAIPDVAAWSAGDKADLLAASRARALLELGKRGAKAAASTDAMLALLATAPARARDSVLLALPLVAPLPCPRCATALAAAVAADHGDAAVAAVTLESDILRAYFAAR